MNMQRGKKSIIDLSIISILLDKFVLDLEEDLNKWDYSETEMNTWIKYQSSHRATQIMKIKLKASTKQPQYIM